jgi:hypothetical protein
MIKIAITAEAFEAIARTLPGASVSATVAPHFLRAREGTQVSTTWKNQSNDQNMWTARRSYGCA